MLRDSSPKRVLFIFLDGVGIGPEDPDRNPFLVANLPTLRKICGGAIPSLDDAGRCVINPSPTAVVVGLDAVLGVSEGIPQSGTGQAALLTGENAPAAFGRHFGPWVPSRLRDMVAESNLFRRARSFLQMVHSGANACIVVQSAPWLAKSFQATCIVLHLSFLQRMSFSYGGGNQHPWCVVGRPIRKL